MNHRVNEYLMLTLEARCKELRVKHNSCETITLRDIVMPLVLRW